MTEQEPTKRRALGRGLESLLPRRAAALSVSEAAPRPESAPAGTSIEIDLDKIDRSPYQTRSRINDRQLAELATSILATGVVQPIIVRTRPDGRFQLIAGERRWLASGMAKKSTIPAIVREVSDAQAIEMTIVENLQREDLNPIEQARAYDRLGREFSLTQEQMAQRTGKDRASVTNFLRLLRLPPMVQAKVEGGELSFGHARALLSLDDAAAIVRVTQKVLSLSMSVRQTETYIKGILDPQGTAQRRRLKEPLDPNVREAKDLLQRALGLRVTIQDRKGKGRVIIEYAGLEDFDGLMEMLIQDR